MPFTCLICNLICRKKQTSIKCSICHNWIHHNTRNKCPLLTNEELELLNLSNKPWACPICVSSSLPFGQLDENQCLLFNLDKNDLASDDINLVPNAEISKFAAKCDKILNSLVEIEDDELSSTSVDSKYYDISQLNSLNPDLSSSFGMFHVNIASLNKHIDDLRLILTALDFKFDIIGISEHKIRKGSTPKNNIDIPGYQSFIFQPTESSHGGTGFYLKNNVNYIERHDLALNSPSNFESAVIEINFPKRKNLIVACIYRHPTSKISIHDFNKNNMDPFLQKISDENKQCVLMGDFNIDLLKCDSNNDSNSFYNILSSNFFTPYVLQPTRLHSKTLIDNLFFNSLEYTFYSGNLLIEISDHLIQFLILEGFIKERPIPILNMYIRDHSNFNENEFKEAVDGLDWHSIVDINQKDPNHSLNNFYNSITYLLDEFAPKKKVTRKEYKLKFKPWITNVIL